jgi:hypothetical protein
MLALNYYALLGFTVCNVSEYDSARVEFCRWPNKGDHCSRRPSATMSRHPTITAEMKTQSMKDLRKDDNQVGAEQCTIVGWMGCVWPAAAAAAHCTARPPAVLGRFHTVRSERLPLSGACVLLHPLWTSGLAARERGVCVFVSLASSWSHLAHPPLSLCPCRAMPC